MNLQANAPRVYVLAHVGYVHAGRSAMGDAYFLAGGMMNNAVPAAVMWRRP